MCRKLFFLTLFVLVCGLSSAAQAEPIDVNNFSFEFDVNGEYFTTTGLDTLQGWTLRDTTGWASGWNWVTTDLVFGGVEVEGFEAADGNAAVFSITWHDPEDANEFCALIQILDPNLDADAVIAENRRYTLTFNALRCSVSETPNAYGAIFYSLGGVNIPPANDVILASETKALTWPTWDEPGYAGWEEVTVNYLALPGAASIGKRLGVQLAIAFPHTAGTWAATDNVRVEWKWATNAWDPDPADGTEGVARDATLSWTPGPWAQSTDGQEVYFGTSFDDVDNATTSSDVFQRAQDGNSWSVLNYAPSGLDLGGIYYWRIDEVNESYVGTSPPPPPDGRWKGEVWSFVATGRAIKPSPADGSEGVLISAILSWTPGDDANTHDVYFGTDQAAVESAGTGDVEFKGGYDVNTYDPSPLSLDTTYYWRIDEIGSVTIKGKVWSFTTRNYEVVDDMESYVSSTDIDDTWVEAGKADITLQTAVGDANYVRGEDGNSMKYNFQNKFQPYYSQTTRTFSPAQDWTVSGFKALTLYFRASVANLPDAVQPMYVFVSDGTYTGTVEYDDPNALIQGQVGWQEWNIDLQDFADADVDLSNVTELGITIGDGDKAGAGYVYFDDIRLYSPGCFPDKAYPYGDLTGDCVIDGFDLFSMANDWLKSGIWAAASPPADPPEVWYRFDEGSGSLVVKNDGSWGSDYDIAISSPPAADEPAWTTDVAPALDPCDPNYALEFDGLPYEDGGDYLEIPNLPSTNFAGTQNMTITAWIKGPVPQATSYTAFVVSAQASGDRHATGLGFGAGADRFNYFWNNYYWEWDPELLIASEQWTFMAIAVEPTQATAYVYDGATLSQAINVADHGPLEDFDTDCWSVIGSSAGTDVGYYDGIMDDVRLYNKTLTVGEVMGVAGAEGFIYLPLESIADLVVGIKAPDDPEEPVDDQVDFRDYAILADNWLTEQLWP